MGRNEMAVLVIIMITNGKKKKDKRCILVGMAVTVSAALRAEMEQFLLGDRLDDLVPFAEFLDLFPAKYRFVMTAFILTIRTLMLLRRQHSPSHDDNPDNFIIIINNNDLKHNSGTLSCKI